MNQLKKPVWCVLGIYFICFLFRIVEYFFIRTDQTFWGEAFLHKLVGIVVLCFAMKMFCCRPQTIGFTRKHVLKNIFRGVGFGMVTFAIAYGAEVIIAMAQGQYQSMQFYVSSYAVDGNIGNRTGLLFFAICIGGNIINVLMEEGVFRGLFQRILEQKFHFVASAIMVSVLFGLWHVMGPIRNYYDGSSSMGGMIANILVLVITSGLVGFKYSLLTKLTGSLYMAMGDHFVNNTIVNILHVVSNTGTDQLMFVRISIAQALSFVVVLVWYLKSRKKVRGR